MTTGKMTAWTRWTFVGKLMSLLFNMLSRLVITFLPRSKRLLISLVIRKMQIRSTTRYHQHLFSSVQFSSVAQSCPTLCDPMNHSTPGLPVHHHLPEFTQSHVHRVRDAIQPSHPWSSPSPPASQSLPASVFSNEQASFNFMVAVTICSDFGAQENKVCHCFTIYFPIWNYHMTQ